jgi:DNA (cytosine-5)-methyltransferase 1
VSYVEAANDHPLRQVTRPDFELGEQSLRVVDLFAGCGGLTLGVAQAARACGWALDVALALDIDFDASAVYKANFPKAIVKTERAENYFGGPFGGEAGDREEYWAQELGAIHALIGGPPCQGHSNLNNHTRGNDPKNALYLIMGRAAEILRPDIVIIENVPAVQRDRSNVVGLVRSHLSRLGYRVGERVIRLEDLGVPQRRRRHILLATTTAWPHPSDVFSGLTGKPPQSRDLRWAIGDLADLTNPTGIDKIPDANPANVDRMRWLLANNEYDLPNYLRPKCHRDEHTYKSMYGRLKWTEPAQTITTGFSSIGQGRYMHPDRTSALTVHEAARIQGFPDYFNFSAATMRKTLTAMVGNAVPPELTRRLINRLLRGDVAMQLPFDS